MLTTSSLTSPVCENEVLIWEKEVFVHITQSENIEFLPRELSFLETFDTIHFVSSGKASAEDMISITHIRQESVI